MATIFVTGATGVLGRGTIARLVAAGHHVRGAARNQDRVGAIEALGADAVVVDLFDGDDVKRAVDGANAVVHLATRIPALADARRAGAWEENDRLRADATRLLVDAASSCDVGRFVAESITFVYADGGDAWLDERAPVDASPGLQSVVTLEREVERFAGTGGTGVVLRFGAFYGPATRSTDELLVNARRRVAPVIGRAGTFVSSIHTDDAAAATARSLTAPSGIYNVVDDDPLTRREHADAFARAFGLHHLFIVPGFVARRVAGPAAGVLMRSQRVRNDAFRTATGWAPAFPDARVGWAATAAARKEARNG